MSPINDGEDSGRDRAPLRNEDPDHPPTASLRTRAALTILSIVAAALGVAAAAIALVPTASLEALLLSVGALGGGILAMQLRTPRPLLAIVGVVLGALAVALAISVGVNATPRAL